MLIAANVLLHETHCYWVDVQFEERARESRRNIYRFLISNMIVAYLTTNPPQFYE